MKKVIIFICIMFINPVLAYANQELNLPADPTDAINLTEGTTNIGFLLVRYLIAVIFVVSLLYFTLKYITKKNEPKYQDGNWSNVLDYNYMGNNRGLYLVEINNEGYVIGSTENSLNLLTKIEKNDFEKIKSEIILNKEFNDFTINPFKKKEQDSFQNHLKQNIKIAEKYFNKKRD